MPTHFPNPFCHPAPPAWGVPYTMTCDAKDRIDMVRQMGIADLEAVVAMRRRHQHLQLTVLRAAECRLAALRKKEAK